MSKKTSVSWLIRKNSHRWIGVVRAQSGFDPGVSDRNRWRKTAEFYRAAELLQVPGNTGLSGMAAVRKCSLREKWCQNKPVLMMKSFIYLNPYSHYWILFKNRLLLPCIFNFITINQSSESLDPVGTLINFLFYMGFLSNTSFQWHLLSFVNIFICLAFFVNQRFWVSSPALLNPDALTVRSFCRCDKFEF